MKFGAHVSIAGGFANAPERAADLGCEIFQIFSRSPRGGKAPTIEKETIKSFDNALKQHKQSAVYIHTPYFINFASSNKKISHGSVQIVRDELERANLLEANGIMTHLGSAKDCTPKEAIKKTAQGIAKVLSGYKGSAKLMLELSAGAGAVIGASFEDMAEIIKQAEKILKKKNCIYVCLDTAHIFASGYDLRDKKSADNTFKSFDKIIGLKRLLLLHGNDSKVGIGEKKDRHEHIGKGKIGKAGFEAIVKNSKLKNINLIVETPSPEGMKKDIALLKKMRS